MNNLPPNWSWVKLGDVCETTSGGTPSRKYSKYYEGNIPWIKSGELNFNTITASEEKITKEAIKSSSAKIFSKGTLLIALYGATVGRLAFLGIDAATNQAIAAIFTPQNLSNKFLYWYLFSYRENLLKQRIGGAQPNISQGTLKNIPIPLPPLPEQKKIVEKIEELFSGLDSGVASLKKAKEQLRLYRQSVLASAFNGRLDGGSQKSNVKSQKEMLKAAEPEVKYKNNGLPESWKWVKLGEVVDSIRYGTSKKCVYEKVGKPVLRIPNIINGYINDDDLKYSEFNKVEIKELSLDKNDILIIRSNGSLSLVGKTAIVSNKYKGYLYAGYLIRIRLKADSYNSKFLNLLFSSTQLRNQIEFKAKSTSGVNNINAQEIQTLDIPLPPLTQQTQIVEEIESRFAGSEALEKAIDDSLTKAETLRQSILKRAFEGTLI